MERRNEIFILLFALAILFIGFTFFDGSNKTGNIPIRPSKYSIDDCNPHWFCVDSNTRAYRNANCSVSDQTDCGLNEECTNGQCVQVTHKACLNNACTIVQGPGNDECTTNTHCQQNTCTDTDGGLNYTIRGTVSGQYNGTNYTFTDYCFTVNDNLIEYYCGGTDFAMIQANCTIEVGPGSICQEGACTS